MGVSSMDVLGIGIGLEGLGGTITFQDHNLEVADRVTSCSSSTLVFNFLLTVEEVLLSLSLLDIFVSICMNSQSFGKTDI